MPRGPAKPRGHQARGEAAFTSFVTVLSEAPDSDAYEVSENLVCQLDDVLREALPRRLQAGSTELLQVLLEAVSNGFEVLADWLEQGPQQQPAADSGAVAVCRLSCLLLGHMTNAQARDDQARMGRLLSGLASSTGLLSGMQRLAAALAEHYGSTGQQQQQQQQEEENDQSALAAVACCSMLFFSFMAEGWPPQGLDTLAPAAASVAGLAMAALRNPAAQFSSSTSTAGIMTPVGASGSPSGRWARGLSFLQDQGTVQTAVMGAQALMRLMQNSAQARGGFLPARISSSMSVFQLLLARVALRVQQCHREQRGLPAKPQRTARTGRAAVGTSRTSRSRLAQQEQAQAQEQEQRPVPPYHEQLLKALGIPDGVELPGASSDGPWASDDRLILVLVGVMLMCQWAFSTISRSDYDDAGESAAAARLLVPTALLAVECTLLEPTNLGWTAACLKDLLIQHAEHCSAELSYAPHTAAAAWQAQEQIGSQLVPALLTQLLPVARQQLKENGSREERRLFGGMLSELARGLMAHITLVDELDSGFGETPARHRALPAVLSAFAQHTAEYCFVLEAGIRHGDGSTSGTSLQAAQRAHAAASLFALAVGMTTDSSTNSDSDSGRGSSDSASDGGAAASSSSSSSGSAGAWPAVTLDSQKFGSAVLPMLISCLKAAAAAGAACAAPAGAAIATKLYSTVLETFWMVIGGALVIGGAPDTAAGASDASDSVMLASLGSTLWCVLLGRCCVVLGRLLQQQPRGGSSTENASKAVSALGGSLACLLHNLQVLAKSADAAASQPLAAAEVGSGRGRGSGSGGLAQLPKPLLLQLWRDHGQLREALQQVLPAEDEESGEEEDGESGGESTEDESGDEQQEESADQEEEAQQNVQQQEVATGWLPDGPFWLSGGPAWLRGGSWLPRMTPGLSLGLALGRDGAASEAAESDSSTEESEESEELLLTPEELSALGASLEAFGAAVCGLLPTKQCCNYHGCSNLAGPGEQQLASGPNCVCSGCRAARYCSAACQKAHWKGWHKAMCKR